MRDVHYRRGTHKTHRGKDLEKWGIRELVREATFLPRELRDLGMAIIEESSKILHGKQKHETRATLGNENLSLMRKTFLVVEKLYSN